MSASVSLEGKFEALMKNFQAVSSTTNELKQKFEESKGQNAYLRKQLGESMKIKQKLIQSPTGSIYGEQSEIEGYIIEFSIEEETFRCSKREHRPTMTNSNGIRIKILEFEGKLDPDGFLEWLQKVECIFEYKEVM